MANKNFNARHGLTVANTVLITNGSNIGIGNTEPSHQLRVEGNTSVKDTIFLNSNGVINSTGMYHTGVMNAASHTVGTSTVANSSGVYTGVVNATTMTTTTVNATTVNTTSVIASQVNTSAFHATTSANVGANVQLSTTGLFIGDSVTNVTINSTSFTGTSNNTLFVGSVSAANVVSNAQLAANLLNYQTTAGLASNVVTLTANNTLFVGSVSAANVVSNAQLAANLLNYQTTAGLSANVATLTANNTSFVGSVAAANVVSNAQLSANLANYLTLAGLSSNLTPYAFVNTNQLSTNLSNYQTTAGLSANVATLTANDSTNLGGTAAAVYVKNTDSRTLSGNLVFSGANLNITGTNTYVTSNVNVNSIFKVGVTTINTTMIDSTGQINAASHTVGTATVANSLGVYANNINATSVTIGTSTTVNSTVIYTSGAVNTGSLGVIGSANVGGDLRVEGDFIIQGNTTSVGTSTVDGDFNPSTNGYSLGNTSSRWNLVGINITLSNVINIGATSTLNSTSISLNGNFTANQTLVNAAALNVVNQINTATLHASTSANVGSNVQLTTSQLSIGNSIANSLITFSSARIANTTGNVSANPTQFSVKTSSDGANLFVNSTSIYIGNTTADATNVAVNSSVITVGNSTVSVSINSTAFSGSANNTTYLNGQLASFYRDATNINAGTIGRARLPTATATEFGAVQIIDSVITTSTTAAAAANSVKAAYDAATNAYSNAVAAIAVSSANNAAFLGGVAAASYVQNTDSRTLSGNLIFSGANVTFTGNARISGGLFANGSLGTAGHVLHSNGTSVYWDIDDNTGTVTSVASGNGLSGGPITSSGTLSVLANNGIVSNSTGVWVLANTNQGLIANSSGVHAKIGTGLAYDGTGNLAINSTAHVDHTTVTITAGNGLTGGGTIAASRTIDVLANNGIVSNSTGVFVNANTGLSVNSSGVFVNTTQTANLIFSGANVTFTGNARISGGLFANGSLGTAGHVLHSNGTSVYWDIDDNTGTVTSVGSGNGLTGGPITSSGSLSVLANSGIVSNSTGIYVNANNGITANSSGVFAFGNTGLVVNSTGIHVNSSYIGTLTANNATNLGGVAAASYVQNTESRTLSGNLIFSGANVTFSGNARFSGGVYANGSLGTANQVLTSNGTSVYWANSDNTLGQHTIWIPATAMTPTITNGAAFTSITQSAIDTTILAFDSSTIEYASFIIQMPKSWNEGTLIFQPIWSHPSTTTNFGVVWTFNARAYSNNESPTTFTASVTSTHTGGTTGNIFIGPETSALTVDGTPSAEDLLLYRISRAATDGSDTLAVDAYLIGIKIHYTTDAGKDD